VPRGALRGKVVVVGATAPSLQDRHATATSGSDTMSGPEVQANAIWTALHGNPLRDAPPWLALVAIALLALAVPLASLRLRPLPTLVAAGGLAAGTAIAAQAAFDHGLVVAVTGPLLALGVGTLATFVATRSRRAGGDAPPPILAPSSGRSRRARAMCGRAGSSCSSGSARPPSTATTRRAPT